MLITVTKLRNEPREIQSKNTILYADTHIESGPLCYNATHVMYY